MQGFRTRHEGNPIQPAIQACRFGEAFRHVLGGSADQFVNATDWQIDGRQGSHDNYFGEKWLPKEKSPDGQVFEGCEVD